MFGGKVAGIEQPEPRILSPAGYRMLDFGGKQDIGALMLRNFGEIGAGTAADGNAFHPVGPWSGLQDPWWGTGLADADEKIFAAYRCGISADAAESAFTIAPAAGGHQWLAVLQGKGLGKNVADAASDRIEIGMAGDDADVVAGSGGDESADGGVGAECLQGPEDDGVVGENEIVSTGAGLVDQGTGGVKREQDAVDRLLRIANQETDIVPVFSQVFRGYVLQDIEKVLNGRHSVLLSNEKEAHPQGGVPLF